MLRTLAEATAQQLTSGRCAGRVGRLGLPYAMAMPHQSIAAGIMQPGNAGQVVCRAGSLHDRDWSSSPGLLSDVTSCPLHGKVPRERNRHGAGDHAVAEIHENRASPWLREHHRPSSPRWSNWVPPQIPSPQAMSLTCGDFLILVADPRDARGLRCPALASLCTAVSAVLTGAPLTRRDQRVDHGCPARGAECFGFAADPFTGLRPVPHPRDRAPSAAVCGRKGQCDGRSPSMAR